MSENMNIASACSDANEKPSALGLFSGAGGMDLGFAQAGFNLVAAVEIDKSACSTHRANFPGTKLFEGDVREVRDEVVAFARKAGVDVIIGGPPCTGFSSLGNRDPDDQRNRLVLDFLQYVDGIRPKAFTIENVGGMKSMPLDGYMAADLVVKKAASIGYKVELRELCAADYGVPQMRKRLIFIGTRFDVPILFPLPTHGPDCGDLKPYMTVGEAIGDLQDNELGQDTIKHSAARLQRIKITKPGEYLDNRNHGLRLERDKPAGTLTCNNGSTVLHYCHDRMITNSEMAALQGFPRCHVFRGNRKEIDMQIGNALPPLMAKAIALGIGKMLDSIKAGASLVVIPEDAPEGNLDVLRGKFVAKINASLRAVDLTANRSDAHYLIMGRYITEYIQQGMQFGAQSEDALFRSIVQDKTCKVKKSAIYNARGYFQLHSAMVEAYGKAPSVSMTYFVKVRSKYLSVEEKHELLCMAEADHTITVVQMGKLLREKLIEKGFAKSASQPADVFLQPCRKALHAVAQIGGLLKKGLCPSHDSFLLVMKTAEALAVTVEKAKRLLEDGAAEDANMLDDADEAGIANATGFTMDMQGAFEQEDAADGMVGMERLS